MAKRRLTGATRGIAYSADADTEVTLGTGTTYFNNAYSASLDMTADEIDTTAFGDYPFGTSEPGFLKFSIELSMRHQVDDGVLATDVAFIEAKALSREPFRIAIVDDRTSLTPNGFALTVVATKATNSGEFSGAQDHNYSLTLSSGLLPPKRIVGGTFVAITA